MKSINPIYIPRNHLVEKIIDKAVNNNDFSMLREMLSLIREPYKNKKNMKKYSEPPSPREIIKNTFCGT